LANATGQSFDNIVAARSGMIGMLDGFRHLLEDLGGGLGITDPISGSAVLELGGAKKKAKRKAAKRAKPAKKKAAKKKTAKRGKKSKKSKKK